MEGGGLRVSPSTKSFLDSKFVVRNDLAKALSLAVQLEREYSDSDLELLAMRRKLASTISSWNLHSFKMAMLIKDTKAKANDFGRHPDESGDPMLKRMKHMLTVQLPLLAREVRRIEAVRNYAETTLKLESLVGDLEDTLRLIMTRRSMSWLHVNLANASNQDEIDWKLAKLHLCVDVLKEIESVLTRLSETRPQWECLIQAVDSRVDKVLSVLKPQAIADYRAILVAMGWPPPLLTANLDKCGLLNPLVVFDGIMKGMYSRSFVALCAFQRFHMKRQNRLCDSSKMDLEQHLWTIDELTFPIALRAEHHFLKWIDEPKFTFALVYKITRDYVDGVDDLLQPLIDEAKILGFSAREAWVQSMVDMLKSFLKNHVIPLLADKFKISGDTVEVNTSWIQIIDLMVSFDKQMQALASSITLMPSVKSWGSSVSPMSPVISIMSLFVDRADWFQMWIEIEWMDSEKKLNKELDKENVLTDVKRDNELDIRKVYQSHYWMREDDKIPKIAVTVTDITQALINRCQSLPNMFMQTQFLRSTASRILVQFVDVLWQRCEKLDAIDPIVDCHSLIKVVASINAARHCESVLEIWCDDIYFLELSAAENSSDQSKNVLDSHDCFFQHELEQLMMFETEWLAEIMAFLLRQFDDLSSEYFRSKDKWNRVEETNGIGEDPPISSSFLATLDALQDGLTYFSMNLHSKDFLDLWRGVANGLDCFIFSNIPLSNVKFSCDGVEQFVVDMKALFRVFQPFCDRPEAFFPCTKSSILLLSMPPEKARRIEIFLSHGERPEYLHSHGVNHVSAENACKILRSRC